MTTKSIRIKTVVHDALQAEADARHLTIGDTLDDILRYESTLKERLMKQP